MTDKEMIQNAFDSLTIDDFKENFLKYLDEVEKYGGLYIKIDELPQKHYGPFGEI